MRLDRMEQWSRYVQATGIDAMFVGEEWADYLSTQVYYAAARGQERILCQLLEQGANPDWYHPQDGLTPLQVTVYAKPKPKPKPKPQPKPMPKPMSLNAYPYPYP